MEGVCPDGTVCDRNAEVSSFSKWQCCFGYFFFVSGKEGRRGVYILQINIYLSFKCKHAGGNTYRCKCKIGLAGDGHFCGPDFDMDGKENKNSLRKLTVFASTDICIHL